MARLPADEQGRSETVFAPFVLEGEKIEASLLEQKRSFARGRSENILQASPHRVEPQCPYFQRCGGCHYQHASYEHQLEIKVSILKENLRRIAKIELEAPLTIHPSPPWNYRNRTRLKFQTAPEFALGYHRFNSHELLSVTECPISSPLINRAMAALWERGRACKVPEGVHEVEFFANADDTALLLEFYCAPCLPRSAATQIAEELKTILPEVAGVVIFKADKSNHSPAEPQKIATAGAGELNYSVQDFPYRVSAGSFFQVNRHLTNELVKIVTGRCSGRTALDLYAGVGLFSTVLAGKFAQVIAVEPSPTAHADLLYNSPPNMRAVRSTADGYLKEVPGKLKPDLVVVDPPRSGLGERVVRSLVGLAARHLTYVSCDPATVARDLAGLRNAGYRIEQAHLVDLFPQTYHLESVFLLAR